MRNDSMVDGRRRLFQKTALVVGSWIAYILAFFPLFQLTGLTVLSVAALPVAATSWFFGTRPGLIGALLAFPLNLLLTSLSAGNVSYAVLTPGGLLGSAVIVILGIVVGRLHDLSDQLKQQLGGRVQAEQVLQRQNQELAVRNAVAQAVSASLELQQILDEALSIVITTLAFEGGLVTLVDRQMGDLRLVSARGLPPSLVDLWETCGIGGTLCELVYQRGSPLSLGDLDEPAPVDVGGLTEAGLRCFTGAPILYKDRTLGTLCLFDTVPRVISEADCDLLTAIGQQIGIAVESAQLFGDVVREREVTRILLSTTEALSTTLRIDRLLDRVLDELQRVVPYDAASIRMVSRTVASLEDDADASSPVIWTVASRGPEQVPPRRYVLEELPLVQQLVQERSPIIVPDVTQETKWSHILFSSPRQEGSQGGSWLGVPLVFKDEVMGVLMVDSHLPRMYNDRAARLALAFAQQAALAIENSRLYEEARARLRESDLLNGVTSAFSSTLDMDQILPYVARSLCEILNGTSAQIYSLDDEVSAITVVAEYAVPGTAEQQRSQDLGHTYVLAGFPAAAEALSYHAPVQVRADDPELDPRERAVLEAHGAEALLLLPMVARGHLVGLAEVFDSFGPRRFTKGEVALGQTLVHQAAVAVENAHLYREIEERRSYLESILAAAPDAIVALDALRRIEEWNPGAERLFGYARGEVLGGDIDSLIGQSEIRDELVSLTQTIMQGQELPPLETVRYRRDGSPVDVMVAGSPVLAEGDLVGAVAVYTDISELKRVEEVLRHRTVELQASNEELDAFAHTVAHDLKSPLANIIGFADLLKRGHRTMSREDIDDYLVTIVQVGYKMRDIIDALLLLAGARKMDELKLTPMHMEDIIGDVQQRLRYMIEQFQAEIVLPDSWPAALGYSPWVEEVWVNYVSNAIKYGGLPPRVELGADSPLHAPFHTEEGAVSTVRFWVRDNGAGIPPEAQAKLFTPFTRLENIRIKGHGVGLSIVRRIVERMGGEVGVESEIGQGSTFYFVLPAELGDGQVE
jgi:PAS domain S-box-containing protein